MAVEKRKTNKDAIAGIKINFGTDGDLAALDEGLRVAYLPIQMVRPDPAQPRRVLPDHIQQQFHDERVTPSQALQLYIKQVQEIAQQAGRPFTNVVDLLAWENEDDAPILSAEEEALRELVILGVTLRDDEQVNPLTVVDKTQGVRQQYQIETGERRFWATWIVIDFLPGYEGNGTLPCIIVPATKASPFRQAKENTSRAGLNAVAMARQAARLLLAVYNVEPPEGAVTNDYYRQALDYDLRANRDATGDILAAMGLDSKQRFHQYKSLLGLNDEALELADRYSLEERKLRYVLVLPSEYQSDFIREIIARNMTVAQIKARIDQFEKGEGTDEKPPIPRAAMQIAGLILKGAHVEVEHIVDALALKEISDKVIRARLTDLRQVLEEVDRYLNQ